MKKILIILVLFSLTTMGMAQNSWSVFCGKKELLNTSSGDETKNIILFDNSELASKYDFSITYNDENPLADWKRIMAIFDEKDIQVLIKEDTNSLKMPMQDIKDLLDKNKKIKFYTWALPKDPDLAARIRIRRVYLCTVEMK